MIFCCFAVISAVQFIIPFNLANNFAASSALRSSNIHCPINLLLTAQCNGRCAYPGRAMAALPIHFCCKNSDVRGFFVTSFSYPPVGGQVGNHVLAVCVAADVSEARTKRTKTRCA